MWNGKFFESVALKTLGLRVQLGHTPGECCYNAQPVSCDKFMVIDVHGIHDVAVDFCGCKTAQIHYKQLLRVWCILELFHLLSFESKVSAYKFYHSLARRSDNTGTSPIKDHYSAFLWGVCCTCPACPHPGINIPDGWEDSPPNIRWQYALFLAINSNFWLKRKAISSDDRDPSLNSGWAYFMEGHAYKKFLFEQSTEWQERSTCVSHNTVNTADTKASRGLAATGVGSVVCVRHEMKLPNSVGDLQKGEKYINMDYFVFSVHISFHLAAFNLSYDIAYQWHKKLWSHNSTMPQRLQFNCENKTIRYFVPKFHLKAHIQSCQTTFLLNFSKGVGRMDGEAPECGWADINCVAMSMREMGPGNHRDMLDDHFSNWNWKKTTMLGRTLLHKLKEASAAARAHYEELAELEGAINPSTLALWHADVEAWEKDNTQPNPFESRVVPMTQAMVHLEFAECERRDLQDGIDSSLHAKISPSVLIANGLELEDQQKTSSQNPTDNQKAKNQMHSNALQRKLDAWVQIQTLYMPAVASLHLCAQHDDSPHNEVPEDFILFLPSQLDAATPCNPLLHQIVWRLRYAQNVRLHTYLNTFKTLHIHGYALDLAEAKKCASRLKYEAAHMALDNLGDHLGMPLNVLDMRPMGDAGSVGQSEGRHDIPWIWKAPGVLHNNDARARASRWSEEFSLLIREMQRVLAFFHWEMTQWNERGTVRTFTKDADHEGSVAYAQRQVSVREGLVMHFSMLWGGTLSAVISKLDPVPEINTEMADDRMPSLEGPPLQGDDE
ncbi:uncharacterized protein HD556DRAFT_1432424 [Suillus plorans]|uniref:CxC2-like cysteine cluster KDZ transposase-associated domain-containing protein n=1 Tax=Suillus plorans TaxID=116603 RepID=A0A9P7ANA6_9AGAM|nr:uncharacterized protein HD556DRAFT_1432424 [Suillus plorans]KAG1792970.1 hypothetical protein HD556DRAFT_1432424 [Suillus plorans]